MRICPNNDDLVAKGSSGFRNAAQAPTQDYVWRSKQVNGGEEASFITTTAYAGEPRPRGCNVIRDVRLSRVPGRGCST